MTIHEYKRKVLKRTLKRCMIAAIIMAIPGVIIGIFNRWFLLVTLFAIIPVIYLANRFFHGYEMESGRGNYRGCNFTE